MIYFFENILSTYNLLGHNSPWSECDMNKTKKLLRTQGFKINAEDTQ